MSSFSDIKFKATPGQFNIDEAQGIVECFVAGIGNKDSVGDVLVTGAFAKSLERRKPRVVWGHNWNDPIGKVLEIYEVAPGDRRLPTKMLKAGIGGLYAKVQFNLNSEKGKEAFANVAFFGQEQEWSIGYKTLDSIFDPSLQANILKEVELYEVSPVLHGANQLTGTISVKSEENTKMHGYGCMCPMCRGGMMGAPTAIGMQSPAVARPSGDDDDSEKPIFAEGIAQQIGGEQRERLARELTERSGSPIKLVDATESSAVFTRMTSDGSSAMYRVGYHTPDNYQTFMFGKPEPLKNPGQQMGGQRVVVPSQMPGMPMNVKPQAPQAYVIMPKSGESEKWIFDDQVENLEGDLLDELNEKIGRTLNSRNANKLKAMLEKLREIVSSAEEVLGSAESDVQTKQNYIIPVNPENAFETKQLLDPIFDYHRVESVVTEDGIVITSGLTNDFLAAVGVAEKALGRTLAGGVGKLGRFARGAANFDPNAWDGDGDGLVQEGTPYERPAIPGVNDRATGGRVDAQAATRAWQRMSGPQGLRSGISDNGPIGGDGLAEYDESWGPRPPKVGRRTSEWEDPVGEAASENADRKRGLRTEVLRGDRIHERALNNSVLAYAENLNGTREQAVNAFYEIADGFTVESLGDNPARAISDLRRRLVDKLDSMAYPKLPEGEVLQEKHIATFRRHNQKLIDAVDSLVLETVMEWSKSIDDPDSEIEDSILETWDMQKDAIRAAAEILAKKQGYRSYPSRWEGTPEDGKERAKKILSGLLDAISSGKRSNIEKLYFGPYEKNSDSDFFSRYKTENWNTILDYAGWDASTPEERTAFRKAMDDFIDEVVYQNLESIARNNPEIDKDELISSLARAIREAVNENPDDRFLTALNDHFGWDPDNPTSKLDWQGSDLMGVVEDAIEHSAFRDQATREAPQRQRLLGLRSQVGTWTARDSRMPTKSGIDAHDRLILARLMSGDSAEDLADIYGTDARFVRAAGSRAVQTLLANMDASKGRATRRDMGDPAGLDILSLRGMGLSRKQIAKIYGVKPKEIRQMEAKAKKTLASDPDINDLYHLRASGMSLGQVADLAGISSTEMRARELAYRHSFRHDENWTPQLEKWRKSGGKGKIPKRASEAEKTRQPSPQKRAKEYDQLRAEEMAFGEIPAGHPDGLRSMSPEKRDNILFGYLEDVGQDGGYERVPELAKQTGVRHRDAINQIKIYENWKNGHSKKSGLSPEQIDQIMADYLEDVGQDGGYERLSDTARKMGIDLDDAIDTAKSFENDQREWERLRAEERSFGEIPEGRPDGLRSMSASQRGDLIFAYLEDVGQDDGYERIPEVARSMGIKERAAINEIRMYENWKKRHSKESGLTPEQIDTIMADYFEDVGQDSGMPRMYGTARELGIDREDAVNTALSFRDDVEERARLRAEEMAYGEIPEGRPDGLRSSWVMGGANRRRPVLPPSRGRYPDDDDPYGDDPYWDEADGLGLQGQIKLLKRDGLEFVNERFDDTMRDIAIDDKEAKNPIWLRMAESWDAINSNISDDLIDDEDEENAKKIRDQIAKINSIKNVNDRARAIKDMYDRADLLPESNTGTATSADALSHVTNALMETLADMPKEDFNENWAETLRKENIIFADDVLENAADYLYQNRGRGVTRGLRTSRAPSGGKDKPEVSNSINERNRLVFEKLRELGMSDNEIEELTGVPNGGRTEVPFPDNSGDDTIVIPGIGAVSREEADRMTEGAVPADSEEGRAIRDNLIQELEQMQSRMTTEKKPGGRRGLRSESGTVNTHDKLEVELDGDEIGFLREEIPLLVRYAEDPSSLKAFAEKLKKANESNNKFSVTNEEYESLVDSIYKAQRKSYDEGQPIITSDILGVLEQAADAQDGKYSSADFSEPIGGLRSGKRPNNGAPTDINERMQKELTNWARKQKGLRIAVSIMEDYDKNDGQLKSSQWRALRTMYESMGPGGGLRSGKRRIKLGRNRDEERTIYDLETGEIIKPGQPRPERPKKERAPKPEKETSGVTVKVPDSEPATPKPEESKPKKRLFGRSGKDSEMPKVEDLKQTGGQLGSQPGGQFTDPKTGRRYYVKFKDDSRDSAENEALVSVLSKLIGLNGVDIQLTTNSGKTALISEIVPGLRAVGDKDKKAVQDMFVGLAWLANWDATGNLDNIKVDANGKPMVMDHGGGIRFRARGARKSARDWSPVVQEMTTLRDRINRGGAQFFGDITPAQIAQQVKQLGSISDQDIKDAVDSVISDKAEAKQLADTLIARRDYLTKNWSTGRDSSGGLRSSSAAVGLRSRGGDTEGMDRTPGTNEGRVGRPRSLGEIGAVGTPERPLGVGRGGNVTEGQVDSRFKGKKFDEVKPENWDGLTIDEKYDWLLNSAEARDMADYQRDMVMRRLMDEEEEADMANMSPAERRAYRRRIKEEQDALPGGGYSEAETERRRAEREQREASKAKPKKVSGYKATDNPEDAKEVRGKIIDGVMKAIDGHRRAIDSRLEKDREKMRDTDEFRELDPIHEEIWNTVEDMFGDDFNMKSLSEIETALEEYVIAGEESDDITAAEKISISRAEKLLDTVRNIKEQYENDRFIGSRATGLRSSSAKVSRGRPAQAPQTTPIQKKSRRKVDDFKKALSEQKKNGGLRSSSGTKTPKTMITDEATFFADIDKSLDKEIRRATKDGDTKSATGLKILKNAIARDEAGKTGDRRTNVGSIYLTAEEADMVLDSLMFALDRQVEDNGRRAEWYAKLIDKIASAAMSTFIDKSTTGITSTTSTRTNSRGQKKKINIAPE